MVLASWQANMQNWTFVYFYDAILLLLTTLKGLFLSLLSSIKDIFQQTAYNDDFKRDITCTVPVQSTAARNPCSMHTASNQTVFAWLDRWSRSSEFQPRRVLLPVTLCTHALATRLHDLNVRRCLHDPCDDAVFHHLEQPWQNGQCKLVRMDWLINWVKVLRPTRHKIHCNLIITLLVRALFRL